MSDYPIRAIFIAFSALLTGCVGAAPSEPGGGTPDATQQEDHIDASRGSNGGAAIDASSLPPDAAGFTCRDPITSGLDNGHHNPGQDCMSNCHNHGFTVAGTLYTAGGAAAVGASITVVDGAGQTFDIHTATNGNFFWSFPVTYPLTITASSCPAISPMTDPVTTGGGACNSGGCHGGNANRMHL